MSKIKYTEDVKNRAIALRLAGKSSTEITSETGMKKESLNKLFKEKGIRLTEEQAAAARSRRWLNHAPIINGEKLCSKCGDYLPIDQFHKAENRLTGLVSACKKCYESYYQENAEKIKARVNEHRLENKSNIAEKNKEYYEIVKNEVILRSKEWSDKNPEKRKKIEKKYRDNNKPYRNYKNAEYRAKKKNATPKWLSDNQKSAIVSLYENCPGGYHVDHIVPLNGENVSGLHVPWNLTYLQKYQNESKGNIFIVNPIEVGVCHQYIKRLESIDNDIKIGCPSECSIDDFILTNEKFTDEHRFFIEKYEWLGTVGNTPRWVFTARRKGLLGGVVFITDPYGHTNKNKAELEALISRGACAGWTPKNLGSKLIMFSCKWMSKNTLKRIFFGYSDAEAGEIGTIYQACNFDYLGNHFGARMLYVLDNGKIVSPQYFHRTASIKKWAKELHITWMPEWSKENGLQNKNAIPKDIQKTINLYIKNMKLQLKSREIPPKGKYVMILGKNKKETKILKNEYRSKYFGIPISYPKRKFDLV